MNTATPQLTNHRTPYSTTFKGGSGRSERISTNSTELVLIRGLPGSGKSTMARTLAAVGYRHFEADMFFEVSGQYLYDPTRIRDAHAWCQQSVRSTLSQGHRVVVSNTFTQLRELEPYLAMSNNCRIVEATGRWKNVHDVPQETLVRMASRWEPLPSPLMHFFQQ